MKLPDGPKTPTLVQMLQWVSDPINYLETSAQRYGDIFTGQVGWGFGPHVFVSNPSAIQQIFTKEYKAFSPCNDLLNKFAIPVVGEQSVYTVDAVRHQQKRQFLMPLFHGERVKIYGEIICQVAEQVMKQLSFSQPFTAREVMQDVSIKVILQIVFGLHTGERSQRLKQLLTSWLDAISSPVTSGLLFFPFLQKDLGAWSPWGYFLRFKQQLRELLYTEIQERRQQYDPSRTDILTLMLSARDEKGEAMTDEELHDELLTLLMAGQETTATALSWALYWIHHLPSVRERLLGELDNLGDCSDPIAISRLPYLSAVCSETLRIYPIVIVGFPHLVAEPVELMGYELAPGTPVVANIYQIHHRSDLYPQPEMFKPERFLERQFSPYEYLPFSGGSRRCIGSALAQFEMKLVLATILRRYQLQLCDNRPVRAQRRSTTLAPAGGVKMVIMRERLRQESPSYAAVS